MILRVADKDKEPLNTLIDSDDVCFPADLNRIIKIIPVFNIIYNFWLENNVQLDTVFESLKQCDRLLEKLQSIENKGERYFSSLIININEGLSMLPVIPTKEMLVLFKKYRDEVRLTIHNDDILYIREYFYEFVRKSHYTDKQGRIGSVFFYENLGVAAMNYKAANNRNSKAFCEAEIVETRSMERHDERWLSDVGMNCIYSECLEATNNYWEGKMTQNPQVEYLFSGKYILKTL